MIRFIRPWEAVIIPWSSVWLSPACGSEGSRWKWNAVDEIHIYLEPLRISQLFSFKSGVKQKNVVVETKPQRNKQSSL